MKGKSMSHATAPRVVRHNPSLAFAGTRHSRIAKFSASDVDTDRQAREIRPGPFRLWRTCKKAGRTSATPSHPIIPSAHIIDLEERPHDEPTVLSSKSLTHLHIGENDLGSIPSGEISADATRPSLGVDRLQDAGNSTPSRKRRSEDETEANSGEDHRASPAKRLRTSEPSTECFPVPDGAPNGQSLHLGDHTSSTQELPQVPEDDRWVVPTSAEAGLGIPGPSTISESRMSSSDGPIPHSRLSRWQTPMSSPLGPQTSPYCRRSKISHLPRNISPKFTSGFLMRNVYNDNIARNPYHQNPQWCEDLHAIGFSERLHPTYTCPHEYHPSDPEYDEEWSNETFSDEEWSDSEDTLPSPEDEDPEATVTIVAAPEQPRGHERGPLTFAGWSHWQPPTSFPSCTPSDIHPPWDVENIAYTETKEGPRGVFAEAAELLPPTA